MNSATRTTVHSGRNVFLLFVLFLVYNPRIYGAPVTIDNHIKIDQFGYRPGDKKIAVISNPQIGYNSNSPYSPGNNYQIRNWNDDQVVFTGSPSIWKNGETHDQSGDKIWWFDFSSFNIPGNYYVFDVSNNVGSYQFEINDCVYRKPMKEAVRAFYYQRCGTAKSAPFAQTGWTDNQHCHKGNRQDTDCRLYNDTSISTSRDLSGGWHDAGDYNKYVNFTFSTLMDLLLAFEQNPAVWSDDFNIPESGNGVPDLLDEVKYELNWLQKMQNPNGSVLSMVGVTTWETGSPPSTDPNIRVYGPASTSASLTVSAVFALAAIQFKTIGQTVYADSLYAAAVRARQWAVANPNIAFVNTGKINSGNQEGNDYDRLVKKMAASVFLFAYSGNAGYKSFIDSNYTRMHMLEWTFAYPFPSPEQNMLLYYCALPNATPTPVTAIQNAYKTSLLSGNNNLPTYISEKDAYRSFMSDATYTWGSNLRKSNQGLMFLNMVNLGLDAPNHGLYKEAALGFVNYFHGVNPNALCYLTNMETFGAENSIKEIYHAWFEDGSALWDRTGNSTFGPAPGYVSGGANPTYSLSSDCPNNAGALNYLCDSALVKPPLNQPVQKSYRDWNTGWPQNSWTITEPSIVSQASYIRLLSAFTNPACITTEINSQTNRNQYLTLYPNPATDFVKIEGIENGKNHIQVLDMKGVLWMDSFTEVNPLNIKQVPPGIYILKVGQRIFKLIKQ